MKNKYEKEANTGNEKVKFIVLRKERKESS